MIDDWVHQADLEAAKVDATQTTFVANTQEEAEAILQALHPRGCSLKSTDVGWQVTTWPLPTPPTTLPITPALQDRFDRAWFALELLLGTLGTSTQSTSPGTGYWHLHAPLPINPVLEEHQRKVEAALATLAIPRQYMPPKIIF